MRYKVFLQSFCCQLLCFISLLHNVCFVFFPQNLINEARNITDRALQLLETVRGILNRSDLYVSTGQNNYEVRTTCCKYGRKYVI